MQITDDHVEWAVVNRFQKMLEAPPHPQFNVTHTYALFVSVICWTIERIRTKDTGEADELASAVLKKLARQSIEDEPWSIKTKQTTVIPMTADQFLISLRNAVAHGDARKVRPFHRQAKRGSEQELVGFTFDCKETTEDRRRGIVWSETITLLETDMRRLGIELAELFCKALRHGPHRHDGSFGTDANRWVVERAA